MHLFFALFIALSIIAMIYLLLNGLGLSDILPKILSSILTKISATIIITAIPLGVYDIIGIAYFGKIAIVVFAIGLFITLKDPVYDKIKRECRKKNGALTSEDEWICKKCGEINYKINKECTRCGNINPDWAKEPASGEAWVCKNCGKKNYLTDKNCSTCGRPKEQFR